MGRGLRQESFGAVGPLSYPSFAGRRRGALQRLSRHAATTDSALTWAFLADTQAEVLLDAVADLNERRDFERPVRAFQMNVDRAV